MREDGGGPDAPFTTRDLVENFLAVAFFDEFAEKDGQLVAGGGENRLHRWQGPVRVGIVFGASIPDDQRMPTARRSPPTPAASRGSAVCRCG